MNVPSTSQASPVTSVDEAIARIEALDEALPANDGLRCFNHMYLGILQQIAQRLSQGFFTNPATMTHLDLVFANLYFAAADAGEPSPAPAAWQPLLNTAVTLAPSEVEQCLLQRRLRTVRSELG